jgi:exodeoxyribonuclease VII large subunit
VPSQEQPWSVGALTQRIGATLEDFGPLTVRGELSQAKVYPSGHCYATLKDSEAVLSVVMWRSQVARNGSIPKEGTQVLVRGSLSVYGPRGQYQLVATKITPLGAGDLAARFEELKARLAGEGLFAEERKRPLPQLPRCVGIATAAGSAALADMLHSIRTRFPRMPVAHAPCLVQGLGAAESIAAALARLDAHPEVDVIVCGRGGGSIEDLWAFNEEAVVRAIARCRMPVVSAVGHETDTTLADHVADVRAKTPTAAGELVVPVYTELIEGLLESRRRLDQQVDAAFDDARTRLKALEQHRALAHPRHQLSMRRQRLDELGVRLREAADRALATPRQELEQLAIRLRLAKPLRAVALYGDRRRELARKLELGLARALERARDRLGAGAAQLEALSPLAVIARGYSVVRTAEGVLVRRIAQAQPGTAIAARVGDGWIDARVTGVRGQGLSEPGDLYNTEHPR